MNYFKYDYMLGSIVTCKQFKGIFRPGMSPHHSYLTFNDTSQVTFIYIALLTIQIVSKQLHNIKTGTFLSKRHFIIEFSDVIVQLSSV